MLCLCQSRDRLLFPSQSCHEVIKVAFAFFLLRLMTCQMVRAQYGDAATDSQAAHAEKFARALDPERSCHTQQTAPHEGRQARLFARSLQLLAGSHLRCLVLFRPNLHLLSNLHLLPCKVHLLLNLSRGMGRKLVRKSHFEPHYVLGCATIGNRPHPLAT